MHGSCAAAAEVLADRRASAWVRLVAHHVLGRLGGPGASRHLFRAVHWADHLLGRLSATSDRSAFLKIREDVYLDLTDTVDEADVSGTPR